MHDPPGPRGASRFDFARRAGVAVGIAAGLGVLLALAILGIDILLAAFAGVLLAVLLRALTELLAAHTPLPDGAALAVVLLLLGLLPAAAGWLLAPGIAEQLDEVAERIPTMAEDLEALVASLPLGDRLLEIVRDADFGGRAGELAGGLADRLGDAFYYVLTAFFVGLFGAANPSLYRDAAASLLPPRHRPRAHELLDRLAYTLRWWLIGQGAAMLLIGTTVGVLLAAFGVPLAVPVGIAVGLLGFVPYLGPIVGVVPVALVAATQGLTTLLLVLLAYVIVQNLEGYVALPLIHQRTVYLPPAITIATQMVVGAVLGVMGFILATPLAVVGLVLLRFYRAEVLGDPEVAGPGA